MISKSLSTSEKFASLEQHAGKLAEFCQALFPLLVAHADDHGRQAGDEFTVKHLVHPTSKRKLADFTTALRALHDSGLVSWYQVSGSKFLQIEQFDAHQSGLHKRGASKIPESPGIPRNPPEIPSEQKGTEGKGTELKGKEISSEVNSEPFLEFPVVGGHSPRWVLTEQQVDQWIELYPGVDVRAEARKALAWLLANDGKRKTAKGMPRFLNSWLTRTTDRAGAPGLSVVGNLKTAGNFAALKRFSERVS